MHFAARLLSRALLVGSLVATAGFASAAMADTQTQAVGNSSGQPFSFRCKPGEGLVGWSYNATDHMTLIAPVCQKVEAAAEGAPFPTAQQVYLDGPRTPLMRTTLQRGADTIEVTTFAVAPEAAAASNGRFASYERLDGISGVPDWARPADEVSPEFRNVAWGITRPIAYRLKVPAGAAKRVMPPMRACRWTSCLSSRRKARSVFCRWS